MSKTRKIKVMIVGYDTGTPMANAAEKHISEADDIELMPFTFDQEGLGDEEKWLRSTNPDIIIDPTSEFKSEFAKNIRIYCELKIPFIVESAQAKANDVDLEFVVFRSKISALVILRAYEGSPSLENITEAVRFLVRNEERGIIFTEDNL